MSEPTVKVSFTVTIEMTEAQRAAYAERYGVGFVGIEVANRARQAAANALDGAPWMQGFATFKVMKPHDGWYDDWAEVARDRDGNLILEYKPTGGRYRLLPEEDL